MLVLLALLGCFNDDYKATEPAPVVPGPPVVGAAEGYIRLPFGTPLGGFTARCTCLGGKLFEPDTRQSAYNTAFIESAGVQTYPAIKVIWIENGDDHLVFTKTDSIYSFDGLVDALEDELEKATGEDLQGKVIHATNHSHSSFGTFSDAITFYLGTDRFNVENFTRFRNQVVDVALEAYDNRQPAKIGMGWEYDWDPEGRVYSDRRGINNDLRPWGEGEPEWVGQKDPWLGLVRFDTMNDEPIAMMFNFGIHGIIADVDNALVSGDSGAHIELAIQEQFDEPVVVMHTQGSGGDQSPRGVQDDFARMESVGDLAVDGIMGLYDDVTTSGDPIRLETASRSIPEHPSQIQVTRGGTVDWYYEPYQPDGAGDDIIYDTDGVTPLSPFDEFNSRVGHVFCGTGDLDFPIGKLNSAVKPYSNCMDVDLMSALIKTFFKLDEMPLPLPESLQAGTTASRLGPIPVRDKDGNVTEEELLMGFFPGESTSMYTEQYRRRAAAETGHTNTMMVSYSQDHEGYLLIPEDWLMGEYEADIVVWGPLQGEHIMEGNLQLVDEVLNNDVHEDPDPLGYYARTSYPDKPLPVEAPDQTANAGTEITEPPPWADSLGTVDGEDLVWVYTPLDIEPVLGIPAQVPRGQHLVQFAWYGGDPGVDNPTVLVERNEGGTWTPIKTRAGRTISDAMPDVLVTTTPYPLAPYTAQQDHIYWAGWQALDHHHDRMGLPLGTYRLKITGKHYTGGSTTWPWNTGDYELTSSEFEVVPADLSVAFDGTTLTASFWAPADGFRLVHIDGDQRGDNPIEGPVLVEWDAPGGGGSASVDPTTSDRRSVLDAGVPSNATLVTVTDAYGNVGTWVP